MLTPAVSIWTKCGTTMCCNEFVLFDLQQQTRNQFCKWPHSNNEHWKSVVFKFVSVRQAFLFNADRITYNVECAWYQLSTRIQWKLHWYCRLRDRNRGISVLYYINTSDIPRELSRENFISLHVNMTCYLHTWIDHRCYGYIIYRAFKRKLIWYFTGVYIINRILHTGLWIWILSSRVQPVDHSKIKFIYTRGHVISSMYLITISIT